MHASATAIEQITEELRLIPRGGPKPVRLATLPHLRDLCRVESSLRVSQVGSAMYSYLIGGINTISAIEVEGNLVEPDKVNLCLKLTLKIKSRWLTLPERRYQVLRLLESPFPLEQMRRSHSPERELLRGLANHLVSQSQAT